MIAIYVVEVDLVIHRDKKLAMCTPSILPLEELSSDCFQADVLSPSRAPVTPIAII